MGTRRRSYGRRREYRELTIEPARGETYNRPGEYVVYEYSEYPSSSVLAGQTRRVWVESSESLEELKAKYPTATVSGSRFEETRPSLNHLPEEEGTG